MSGLDINDFVRRLSRIEKSNVFNPYAENCMNYDQTNSASIRRQNLLRYLHQIYKIEPSTIWVGEALGYRGGRRTGLPFSDDTLMDTFSKYYGINVVS